MSPKISKTEVHFEQVCKELDLFSQLIKDCSKKQHSKVRILKSKVQSAEIKLAEIVQNFTIKEHDDNFGTYLRYQEIILDLLVDLEEKTDPQPDNAGYSESKGKNTFVKLPKFDLPNFYGDSEAWISFKELFSSTVLKNENLSSLEKLQYLHSSVRGNAAKLIRGFPLKEENLKHCWDLLCERFENKRLLALSQINKIFSTKIAKAYNSKTLLELVDTCNESIRNLNTLGLESNSLSDLILIQFMVSKLEQPLKQRWELTLESDTIPDLDTFRKFIEREARGLDDAKGMKSEAKFNPAKKPLDVGVNRKQVVNNVIIKKSYTCVVCNQTHALFKCPTFNKMPVFERWKVIDLNKLCQNCLRQNHQIENCRIDVNCKNCAEKHHTLLHVYAANTRSKEVVNNQSSDISISNAAQCYSSKVLLSTALINVKGKRGKISQCKALIDNASQNSLITRACAERLGLPLHSTSYSLVGVNCMVAKTSLERTEFEFTPHFSVDSFSVNAFVVDRVTSPLPNFHLSQYEWPHIQGLQLADPNFFIQSSIDVLLGADIFSRLITGGAIMGPAGTPTAFPSKIGWFLCGQVDLTISSNSSVICHTTCTNNESCLNDTLREFFNSESLPSSEKICYSEDKAEQLFLNTTTRTDEGKYIVRLPFRENRMLGQSKEGVLQRFYTIERKLSRNPDLRTQYIQFMREYINMNHMTILNPDEISLQPNYFLPHHGVVNEHSTTTKLRVVFDASYKSTNKNSLNDVLLKGPKLQKSIFEVLLKFRSYPVALTADIAKMYRQILVAEEDRQYQRIFWRESADEPIKIYKLNTVTYGTACAPYLAIRTIQQLCTDEKERFPQATKLAKTHFYVDDLLAGSDSVDSARIIIQELLDLFSSGGFELRKWSCSHPEVIAHLPDSLKASTFTHSFQDDSSQKILGLVWNSTKDILKIHISNVKSVNTKRELLSTIARFFDPLGFLSPTTIMLKIMMQELWKDKIPWDDPIPNCILKTWKEFSSQIEHLRSIGMPRYLKTPTTLDSQIQLHGFCDGSGKAYAAVMYLRTISPLGEVSVNFVAAKTRVNPIKHVTLPRIELCAAFLLAQLCLTVIEALPIPLNQIYLWSDSQIVLNWIHSPPTKGNQFVTNRANQIKSLIPHAVWSYVCSSSNPSDCASRGILPKRLLVHKLWWTGPEWLKSSAELPLSLVKSSNFTIQTTKEITSHVAISHEKRFPEFLLKFSSYSKLCRVLAFCLRFIHNSHHPDTKRMGTLTSTEVLDATTCLLRLIQESEFSLELKMLKKNDPLPSKSKYLSLNIFLDEKGLIRVGGRLSQHQSLSQDQKHPILLPKNHVITKLIIQHYHKQNFHAGAQLILSLIRQKFWFINGRSKIRQILNECILCRRIKRQACQQIMGDLPAERITPIRPFCKVGIDFAGPIITKPNMPRSKSRLKSYICVIVCMSTKAVHLEAVSDLSSPSLLAALRRFISRRGLPSDIFSDNGKNFKGAANVLKHIFQIIRSEDVQNFATSCFINWHFIPPYSPHFGGLWEAAVKLTKNHLLKACKTSILNFEELSTLLCQIEACLNSRPLTPLSADPSDVRVLTPGHFLIGVPLLEIPEGEHSTNLSLHSRWNLIQRMKQDFWKRWSRDYLHHLQSRPKWYSQRNDLQIGDLVVIHDPQSLPLHWKLGRVIRTHPGPDQRVRVVSIWTQDGEIKRPISKVTFLLPAREDV